MRDKTAEHNRKYNVGNLSENLIDLQTRNPNSYLDIADYLVEHNIPVYLPAVSPQGKGVVRHVTLNEIRHWKVEPTSIPCSLHLKTNVDRTTSGSSKCVLTHTYSPHTASLPYKDVTCAQHLLANRAQSPSQSNQVDALGNTVTSSHEPPSPSNAEPVSLTEQQLDTSGMAQLLSSPLNSSANPEESGRVLRLTGASMDAHVLPFNPLKSSSPVQPSETSTSVGNFESELSPLPSRRLEDELYPTMRLMILF